MRLGEGDGDDGAVESEEEVWVGEGGEARGAIGITVVDSSTS